MKNSWRMRRNWEEMTTLGKTGETGRNKSANFFLTAQSKKGYINELRVIDIPLGDFFLSSYFTYLIVCI